MRGETPTPRMVAAWNVLGGLPVERVPMWAAEWIARGYDGEALAELAGLSGRDTLEVRDLLPAALAEVGGGAMSAGEAAFRVGYAQVAELYLGGLVSPEWVVDEVARMVDGAENAEEALEQPLGGLWEVRSESREELAGVVRAACVAQMKEWVRG